MPDKPHSIPAEGTDVGVIGGLVVAVWFLILDVVAGHPLLTPSLLGQVVLFGDSTPERQVVFLAVLLYTAFHFLVFALNVSTGNRLPLWEVIGGGILGVAAMAWRLWRRHPRLSRSFDHVPLGDEVRTPPHAPGGPRV